MQADYIIIGSGSAGSTLAYRLSESGKHTVLVLEYGGTDAGPFIQMPAALSYPMNMKTYDWGYQSEPEPHLGNRRLATPRGKVIGGSSSINGMVYVRGHAKDYDHWHESGAKGWSYSDVLPYFMRMENWHDGGHGGNPAWRGSDGPLHITRGPRTNPLFHAFVEAGRQAGYEQTDDYNGEKQEGFGPMEQTVWKGRRWSAANAYLRPALKRDNCTIMRCLAQRIIIEDGKAVGVEIRNGVETTIVRANREVIISASSINSPKLLMLSGIGPAAHLKDKGIDVVADRAGVGQNLQDHLELYIQQACTQPITLFKYWNLLGKTAIGAKWLLTKTGLGTSNQFESAALQITLQSSDPSVAPKIEFNYMSHAEDWEVFRHCIRLTRSIFGQEAFDPYRGKEIQPGKDYQSDDELDRFITEHAESAYHPCGTCKMGAADDPMAVVDPDCKVIGVEGLRLADSSIFPRITNGNLNGPSIMVGEKASDHILNEGMLPRSSFKPWLHG